MPKPCATPSVQPWRIPTTRAAAKATTAPPPAATSSSSNATIALPSTGTLRVLSSATCGWTIICQFVTSVLRGMSHRRASCATCSTRRSTHFGRSRRRSRFAATPAPGSRSSRPSLVSTSKARSTAAPTTGRSGAGIASGLKKLSRPSAPRNRRSGQGHLGRLPHLPRVRVQDQPSVPQDLAARPRVAQALRSGVAPVQAQAVQPHVDHVLQDPAGLPARPAHALAGPRGARVDRPIRAKSLSRSIARGGT